LGKAVPYRKWFIGKPRTVERNAQNLRAYCEWLSKTPEELRSEYVKARKTVDSLEDWERETRNNILGYYNYLKENDYAINSARTLTTGVMAFYSQNCKRIQGITKESLTHSKSQKTNTCSHKKSSERCITMAMPSKKHGSHVQFR
jgi:hypothetical protein